MYYACLFFVVLVFSLWYSKVSYNRRRELTFPRSLVMVSQGEHYYNQSVVLYTKKSKKLLESVKLFDIYRDDKIGEGNKSVAYSLIFRDKNKTLSDDEINTIMNNVITELEKNLGAELRKA